MGTTYLLLEEHNSTQLINKINALLVAGWKLQGGIGYNADRALYLQALIMSDIDPDTDTLTISTAL